MKKISKYSMGTGDRFGMQGKAQLQAIIDANKAGIPIVPVWNKSYREHQTVKTTPVSVRKEADNAVEALGWKGEYYVDADHINLNNVDEFLDSSDFFTIDVADYIGQQADENDIENFISKNKKYLGMVHPEGMKEGFEVSIEKLRDIASNYLFAIKKAAEIHRHIVENKGGSEFVTEVSMDEVDTPQKPLELFFILSGLSMENVPVQTIAPRFSGRFNKGVDYIGDLNVFEKEFEDDLIILKYAIQEFGLPENLKLSVHSGSDKFSIYPIIGKLIKNHDAGIHIKTAGTTWLEEMIGLSLAGSDALKLAKDIYKKAWERKQELSKPYASVIDIDDSKLPYPKEVSGWSGEQFSNSLRHIPDHPEYNLHFRQLIHVGYKIAAEFGETYKELIKENAGIIETQVTENIFDRHIKRLFL